LVSPLLASATPCRLHSRASFGDARKAERLNSTALSNSRARKAEVISSIGLLCVCENPAEQQTRMAIATINVLNKRTGFTGLVSSPSRKEHLTGKCARRHVWTLSSALRLFGLPLGPTLPGYDS